MSTAILLAAGLSRRMGKPNKLLLPLGKKNILQTSVEQLLSSGLKDVLVVIGHQADLVRPVLEAYPVKIIENPRYETGMTSSIQAGVSAADATTNGYMICLSDMPFVRAEEYRLLADFFEKNYLEDKKSIVQPVFQGKKGNPVIFSSYYKDKILENTDPEGCKNIVQSHVQHLSFFEMPESNTLKDIDNPTDYEKLFYRQTD